MRWFFATMFFLAANMNWQDEVSEINHQIEQMEDLQRKLRSRVERNVNNAMRWQFQNENYLDARRAWDKAAVDKQKILEIQDQIHDLNKRKSTLLKEHDANPSS
jgi:hypothetical protein